MQDARVTPESPEDPGPRLGRLFETIIQITVGLGLLVWCGVILAPFLHALVWGVLLAVALFPPFQLLVARNGGRERATAICLALVGVAAVLVPTVLLSGSLVDGARDFSQRLETGTVELPPPPDSVADWPVIGEHLHAVWAQGAEDVRTLAKPLQPHLKAGLHRVLSIVGSAAGAIIQALIAILIAAAFLAHSEWAKGVSERLAGKLVGRRGTDFAEIATVTVRGVARGVLGVALIQSTLAGIGFAVVGIPAAGLWAVVCLALCVMQIPAALIILPTIIYVFSAESGTTATIYAVWGVLVALSDNFLKPFMFGDKVRTPVLILLIGSIGGMISSGVVGLFTGAVILSLGYELTYAWLHAERPDAALPPGDGTGDDRGEAAVATG